MKTFLLSFVAITMSSPLLAGNGASVFNQADTSEAQMFDANVTLGHDGGVSSETA